MGEPVRIQLSRAKGWRMPENTVKVDRSTKWGNPFVARKHGVRDVAEAIHLYRLTLAGYFALCAGPDVEELRAMRRFVSANMRRLRGKNLACWCRAGQPCHADVLLELANAPQGRDG